MSYSFQVSTNRPLIDELHDLINDFNAPDSMIEANVRLLYYTTTPKPQAGLLLEIPPTEQSIFYYTSGASSGATAKTAAFRWPWTYLTMNVSPYIAGQIVVNAMGYMFSAEQLHSNFGDSGINTFVGNHSAGSICMGYGLPQGKAGMNVSKMVATILNHYFNSTFNNNISGQYNSSGLFWMGLQLGDKKIDAGLNEALLRLSGQRQTLGYYGSFLSGDDLDRIYKALGSQNPPLDWSEFPSAFRLQFSLAKNVWTPTMDQDLGLKLIQTQHKFTDVAELRAFLAANKKSTRELFPGQMWTDHAKNKHFPIVSAEDLYQLVQAGQFSGDTEFKWVTPVTAEPVVAKVAPKRRSRKAAVAQ